MFLMRRVQNAVVFMTHPEIQGSFDNSSARVALLQTVKHHGNYLSILSENDKQYHDLKSFLSVKSHCDIEILIPFCF